LNTLPLHIARQRFPAQVESWVPFLSMVTPSDAFKIWKKGSQLRMDFTFRGMDGMSVQTGNLSFLFAKGSLQFVDHDAKIFKDAMVEFRRPNYERMTRYVRVSWVELVLRLLCLNSSSSLSSSPSSLFVFVIFVICQHLILLPPSRPC
jgi:hypothetical protein